MLDDVAISSSSQLSKTNYDILSLFCWSYAAEAYPNNKAHGVNMGPNWGRQDPGGSHVGHMNFAIWI